MNIGNIDLTIELNTKSRHKACFFDTINMAIILQVILNGSA